MVESNKKKLKLQQVKDQKTQSPYSDRPSSEQKIT